jgi:hypothetical protein
MPREFGIWIDHAKAVISNISDGVVETAVIESNIERKSKSSGMAGVMPPGHLHGAPTKKTEHRIRDETQAFYRQVIARCRGAEAVLIFGPGRARRELASQWRRRTRTPEITVEAADRLTRPQMLARVRDFLRQREEAAKHIETKTRARVRWTKARRPGTRQRRT